MKKEKVSVQVDEDISVTVEADFSLVGALKLVVDVPVKISSGFCLNIKCEEILKNFTDDVVFKRTSAEALLIKEKIFQNEINIMGMQVK